MKTNSFRLLLLVLLLLIPAGIFAQAPAVTMADDLQKTGKIWVVVGVIGVILLGILGYIALLDRKVTRIENELKKNEGK